MTLAAALLSAIVVAFFRAFAQARRAVEVESRRYETSLRLDAALSLWAAGVDPNGDHDRPPLGPGRIVAVSSNAPARWTLSLDDPDAPTLTVLTADR
jgi:hypothetical protein